MKERLGWKDVATEDTEGKGLVGQFIVCEQEASAGLSCGSVKSECRYAMDAEELGSGVEGHLVAVAELRVSGAERLRVVPAVSVGEVAVEGALECPATIVAGRASIRGNEA